MDTKLLLSIVLLAHYCAGEYLCIYNEGENACTACSRHYSDNLNLDDFTENYTLQFCSKYFKLSSLLKITDSFSVTVKGLPSVVECIVPEAGLLVSSISQLLLQDITLLSCAGGSHSIQYFKYHTVSAIIVANCSHVTIDRLNVTSSIGTGLSMLNNSGRILVQNSTFEKSGHNYNVSSGLYIEVSTRSNSRSLEENSMALEQDCTVINCTFSKNVNSASYGGGMFVMFTDNSTNNQLNIVDSNFAENVAVSGGGLFTTLTASTRNNSLILRHCFFSQNAAYKNGGGMDVGYDMNSHHSSNNEVSLTDCLFSENKAESGGGISYFSHPFPITVIHLTFRGCNWTGNVARFGAAIDMTPQYLSEYILRSITDSIFFQDCIFRSNGIMPRDPSSTSYVRGKGTLTCVGYHINFKGENEFKSNNDSAMYLSSCRLDFLTNSAVKFVGNQGYEGGAIYLLGYSILALHQDAHLTFRDNAAEKKGGAIFQLNSDKTYISLSRWCFFIFVGEKEKTSSAKVIFHNNSIANEGSGSSGHSLYATTLLPCKRRCETESNSPAEIFKCSGRFTFASIPHLSTDGNETYKSIETLTVVPGSTVKLPLTTKDDLSNELEPVYHIQVLDSKYSSVTVISKTLLSGYVIDKNVAMFGKPGETAVLEVATTTAREVVVYINITMQDCPPGFEFMVEDRKCVCIDRIYKHYRNIIESCSEENMTATLTLGYWMGYAESTDNNSIGIQKSLQISFCPRDQCNSPTNDDNISRSLPPNNSVAALSRYVCGETREGKLCSRCKNGYILHFHGDTNICRKSRHSLCYLGWFFYILCEIVPVTMFFSILMLFDFKLMDGAVNGFILFAQLSSSMLTTENGHAFFQGSSYFFLKGYRLLAGIWNLKFFLLDQLSFCLWKSATLMDIIAFRYITVFYSLLLVFLIIAFFQYCQRKKMCVFLGRMKSTKNVVIHGIAGFLILCYSDCVKISLKLLTAVRIQGNVTNYVPFYNGEFQYFSGEHLYYALPALLIVIAFGLIPPVLLISYPLCYKIFSLFKVGESRFVKLLCLIIPLEKFKPFYDSFQFCFRDKCRYFSGLYFLYRFAFQIIIAFAERKKFLYVYIQILLVVMLVIHAIFQPYKKHWHNVLDSLMIMDLTFVNTISLVNSYHTAYLVDATYYRHIGNSFQLILLYIPFVYITAYLSKAILKKVWLWKFKVVEPSDYHEMVESLPLDAAEERLKN